MVNKDSQITDINRPSAITIKIRSSRIWERREGDEEMVDQYGQIADIN